MSNAEQPRPALLCPPRRWLGIAAMAAIFAGGLLIGAVGGRLIAREQFLSMLRHPEQVPDRIIPRLRSELTLDDEQARQVEAMIRRRYLAMETIRSRSYPELIAEFRAMRNDIADVLSPEQRADWDELSDRLEQRYLPTPPASNR